MLYLYISFKMKLNGALQARNIQTEANKNKQLKIQKLELKPPKQ